MHTSKWLQWAGGLGVMGAILLGSTGLCADDEASRRKQADKPADEGQPGRERRKIATDEVLRLHPHYWLGLECMPVPSLIREQLNLPEGQGLVVEITAPDGPAAKAGLKKHDILLTANDKPLGKVPQLIELVQASEGNEISFRVLRGGKETTVSVTPVKGGPQPAKYHARVIEHMEQLRGQLERGGDPIRMRFFHPGVMLPPGAAALPPLPEGMRVTITRKGASPAEIEVQQGEETWKGSEEDLSKMPAKFRGPVAQMLGHGPPVPPGINLEIHGGQPGLRGPEAGVDQRVNELIRQVEQIRHELKELSARRAAGRDEGPGDRKRGPRDGEAGGGERRGEGPPAPRGESPDSVPAREPAPEAEKPGSR